MRLVVRRRLVCVLLLVLLARMRILGRVIDIVVSYTIVARQCASDAWVPPERTALDGRRALNGKNLMGGGPLGQRRQTGRLTLLRRKMRGTRCYPYGCRGYGSLVDSGGNLTGVLSDNQPST